MTLQINGEQIVGAVCRAIHSDQPDIPIYKDPVDQEFEEPCFFVWNSGTETQPVLWPKFKETHKIEIRYYNGNRNQQQTQNMDMGARLIEVLSKIYVKNGTDQSLPIFATQYSRNVIDDALALSITYKTEGIIIFEGEQKAPMQGLIANINNKE